MDEPQLLGLGRPLVQVFCTAPGPVLRARVVGRVASGERHPVHRDGMDAGLLDRIADKVAAGTASPLDLRCSTITVRTDGDVDVSPLVDEIRLAAAASGADG